MQVRYDLYGFKALTLDAARPIVEAAIGQSLTDSDSGYYGGDHFMYRLGTGRGARLYRNQDPNTGNFVRSDHADFAILLEVSNLPDMGAIEASLAASQTPPVLIRSSIRYRDDENGSNE